MDIVRDDDRTVMYDIKTHDPDMMRGDLEPYEKQLNVYAHIWQGLRGNDLDETAIIATAFPATLREAISIEGDNLEVLKLPQKSYAGRIKMIYIDPPYNTGNDFIYKDDFKEPLDSYLRRTGQTDEEGALLTSNTKADGRFHSNWLNTIYPRLRLARNLLRDDRVIFVSIDDNEVHNLRQVMNEVFGEENFIGGLVWRRRQVSDNRNVNNFSTDHEHVLIFSKAMGGLRGSEKDLSKYSNPDNDPRGPWMSDNLTGLATREQRPNLHYDLIDPETGNVYPPLASRGWAYEPKSMSKLIEQGKILWPSKPDGRPRLKRFLAEIKSQFTGFSSVTDAMDGFVLPGLSLHEESALMVEAGLTSMEALQTATRNPAAFLGQSKSPGTVETGKSPIWFCSTPTHCKISPTHGRFTPSSSAAN